MTIIKLDRARAALQALIDLTSCTDDNSVPPFTFGLSVLMGYIAKDLEGVRNDMKNEGLEKDGGTKETTEERPIVLSGVV
jgi:hypothetical protein